MSAVRLGVKMSKMPSDTDTKNFRLEPCRRSKAYLLLSVACL